MPYRANLDPINRRLHARLHQKAIAAVDREESAADACDRIAASYARKVNAVLIEGHPYRSVLHRVRALADEFWQAIGVEIRERLKRMAVWSHQTSVQVYLDVLPPRWFRAIVPQLPLTEAYDPDEPRDASGRWGSGGGSASGSSKKASVKSLPIDTDHSTEKGIKSAAAKWFSSLSPECQMRVEQWTGGDHVEIRQGEVRGEPDPDWDEAIASAPEYDGTVYRSLRVSPDKIKGWNGDKSELTINASSSATRDPEHAERFLNPNGGTLLKIATNTARSIEAPSLSEGNDDEREVILMRGSEYRVVKVERDVEIHSHGKTFNVPHLIELEEKQKHMESIEGRSGLYSLTEQRISASRFVENDPDTFLTVTASATESYDPDEERDSTGKWTGGSGSSKASKPKQTAKQTDTPAFKAWFGDSKVVDAEGKPLVVYHGTKQDFDRFSKNKRSTGNGFFFSTSPENAANMNAQLWEPDSYSAGASVKLAFLRIENPSHSNYRGGDPSVEQPIIAKAIETGHDGVVFDDGKTKVFVAFHPTQIKSATGNKGTFDPKNPNINESIGELPQPFTDFPPDIGFPIAQTPDVPSEPTKKKKPDDDFTRPIAGDEEYQAAVRELLFPPLDLNTINRIIYTPTDGVGWPARLAKWSTKFANPDALASQIATGLSQGQDLRELSKSVKDSFGVAGSTAKRVARSESHRVNLMAHDEASKGLGELKTGSMYQAQLDMNTRPWHAIHHGQIFKVGEPWPETLSEPCCRCTMLDVLAPPEEIDMDTNVKAEFTNAAKEEIPDPGAYAGWWQRASEQDRRLAVGTKRYEAVRNIAKFAKRQPEWTDFLQGESGQLLSPAQLSAESSAQRAVRKAAVGKLIQQRAEDYRSVRNLGFVLKRKIGA